ncbi:MAG: plasmid pRiA4b ORF-3 family protein [Acetobacteraceae bacterium]
MNSGAVLKVKVWLTGISPMIWRRVLVPATITLRELHGVFQVVMGWDGVHLFQFRLRGSAYGSAELGAAVPDVMLADLRLREGARFAYEYDLNIPWLHEVRIEARMAPSPGKELPTCIDGNGACPPEDCGGPEGFMAGLDGAGSLDALEDMDAMVEILRAVVLEGHCEMLQDDETRWRLERAVDRSKARERARGRPFSRQEVNARLHKGEHRDLMHQQLW